MNNMWHILRFDFFNFLSEWRAIYPRTSGLTLIFRPSADPSEETGTKQNMKEFLTFIPNLASGRRAGSVHVTSTSSSKNPSTEQYIGPFKGLLHVVDQKQPKSIENSGNLKASKALKASQRLRGNIF